MSGWNTNFDEIPEGARVLVQYNDGHQYLMVPPIVDVENFLAWHPMPEPYVPPKPEQLKPSSTGHLQLILEVEKRTREIVAWEQKYEVKK
jgi:hypothetical protein